MNDAIISDDFKPTTNHDYNYYTTPQTLRETAQMLFAPNDRFL